MHNHSNDNYINFKNRVNDPGLAFDGKVDLGSFWTLVLVLLYNDVVHVAVSSSVSSFRRTRTDTVREIYTRMQMQDLFDDFNLINHKQ
jgi:sensor histidine kinase YesM